MRSRSGSSRMSCGTRQTSTVPMTPMTRTVIAGASGAAADPAERGPDPPRTARRGRPQPVRRTHPGCGARPSDGPGGPRPPARARHPRRGTTHRPSRQAKRHEPGRLERAGRSWIRRGRPALSNSTPAAVILAQAAAKSSTRRKKPTRPATWRPMAGRCSGPSARASSSPVRPPGGRTTTHRFGRPSLVVRDGESSTRSKPRNPRPDRSPACLRRRR